MATTTPSPPTARRGRAIRALADSPPRAPQRPRPRARPRWTSRRRRRGAVSTRATGDCRADPSCPSSEHRTSDPCGATVIVDEAGYLEGRRDAEQGLPYQIDGAPAPGPEDDDDDDATVGPQTRYRAGYVQGWCDGGGEPPA